MKLSPTDIKILQLLQRDASLTAAEIAEQVNLSPSPCWRRINRLQQAGLIDRRVALLNAEALGLGLVVFARIRLSKNDEASLHAFEESVRDLANTVAESYRTRKAISARCSWHARTPTRAAPLARTPPRGEHTYQVRHP